MSCIVLFRLSFDCRQRMQGPRVSQFDQLLSGVDLHRTKDMSTHPAVVGVSGPGWDEQIACLIAVAVVFFVLCDASGAFDWISETRQLEATLDQGRLSRENILAHEKALARGGDQRRSSRVVRKTDSEHKRMNCKGGLSKMAVLAAGSSTSKRSASPTICTAANFVPTNVSPSSRPLSKPSNPNRMNPSWNTDDSSDDCAALHNKNTRCRQWIQRATLFNPGCLSPGDLTPALSQSEATSKDVCSCRAVTPADIVARWLD